MKKQIRFLAVPSRPDDAGTGTGGGCGMIEDRCVPVCDQCGTDSTYTIDGNKIDNENKL